MNRRVGETVADPAPLALPKQPEGVQTSLLRVVWRRRWTIVLVLAGCLGAALVHLARATPRYTSTSRLYVERSYPKIITESEGVMTESWNYLYTQAELLRSTPIVAAALESLDVGATRTLSQIAHPTAYLKSAVKTEVGNKDEIISVSLESPDPQEAAALVNALVDAYIAFHAQKKRSTAAEVLRILQKEKTKRDAGLLADLEAMLDFKQKNFELAYETKDGNIVTERLARLSDALTAAHLDAIEAKAAYETMTAGMAESAIPKGLAQARGAERALSTAHGDEARLRSELDRLRLQSLELRRECTDAHPAVQAAEQKAAELTKRLAELHRQAVEARLAAAAQRVEAAEQKLAHIQALFESERTKARELNAQLAQFTLLRSRWEHTKKLCDVLDDRIKELNVTEDTGALNITVLEVARPMSAPTSPKKGRTMAIALVLGLMLGIGLAFCREWMDCRFHSADEIAATLGAPVLGVVPAMPRRENLAAHGRKVEADPTSRAAESYRTVRTAIYFGVPNGQAKTLLVTSPGPGDGKTTLVSNLGIAMADAGQRTLIIDADFRKPMQHEVFRIEKDHGLSGVLAGRESLDNSIHPSGLDSLDILPCGPVPPNPSEMLNSKAFADALEELANRYDHILLDSPPVTPVADARILGAMCDLTMLVLRAEKTHRRAAERARDDLLSTGAHLLGAVVNAVPRAQDRDYYSSAYTYYHGYQYGHGPGHGRPSSRDQSDPRKAEHDERQQPSARNVEGAE